MSDHTDAVTTPLWEKLVGLAGFILLCAAIGVLLRNAMSVDDSPPLIGFENINITNEDAGFRVAVEVVNSGGTSVSDVEIEGRVTREDGTLEVSSLRFDYLPAQSRRAGGLFFETNPQIGNLEFRPKSFTEP